jgi:aldehyde dehydrogenase (NAD(P)+)
MVWGPPGTEREARRREGRPVLDKPVSAELGNITPVVMVPGPVSKGGFDAQLEGLAGMFAHNASFNCVAAKLLVTQQGWAGRESMLERLQGAIARAPARGPYYPGAEERWRRLTAGRPGLRLIGEARAGTLPWALVSGLSSADADEPLFAREPWCGVLAETSVPAGSAVEFLERSVAFLNQRVWGSLCAVLILPPASLRDREMSAALQRALGSLRYGTVCINTWPGAAFGLGMLPWGGYPGATARDIQSGVGWVHNPLMLEGVEKVVMRGPFKPWPRSIWSPGHRTLKGLGAGLAEQERNPRWWRMARLAWKALGA